jgi:hypothetical protein
MAAWIEVSFAGLGWIPFDVTPPRDRPPQDESTGVDRREVAVPNPPIDPPPPVLPPELDTDTPETTVPAPTTTVPAPTDSTTDWGRVGLAAGAAIPTLTLLAAATTIVLLKRRRTDRRRHAPTPTARIGGAWREVSDRFEEAGLRRPRHATPTEYVRGLGAVRRTDDATIGSLLDLANDLDEAVYHPEPRPSAQAEAAWRRSDEVVAAIRASDGRLTRWRRALDPRPLMREDRALPEPAPGVPDPVAVTTPAPPEPLDQEDDVHA